MAGAIDIPVRFLADASSVAKEADKVEGTGGKLKSWAKGIGGAIAGAFAVDQVRQWIGSASELQDAVAASETIFGSAAGAIKDFAATADTALGMSKQQATDAANTFATFGKGAGLAGNDLAGFSTQLTTLAGDMASFRGTSPEQAITAVGAALRGETEPIRAYGVMLDEGAIKARALSMGLVQAQGDTTKIAQTQLTATKATQAWAKAVKEHGAESDEAKNAADAMKIAQDKLAEATAGTVPELTQQQKVMATQAEIMAQTGDAQGDFARTSDSAANQQKILSAEMENAKAAIGTALLPVLQKILPPLQSMAKFFQDNASVLVPLVGSILALVAAYRIFVAIQAAVNAVLALFGVTSTIALGPLILIVLGIVALIAIVVLLWKNWDTVWNAIVTAFDAVKNALITAWDAVKNAFLTAWDAIKNAFSIAVGFIGTVLDSVIGFFAGVIDWLKSHWPLILAILTGPFGIAVLLITQNWDTIKGVIAGIPGFIQN